MSDKVTTYFSIVVPVYNVAPYLRECLDSVLAQTFTNWECLCVDDGSTDECGVILDEYVQKDSRFRVFHKKNGGVSSARNLALENVRGKWFLFLDGDDKFFIDALASFYSFIEKEHCDGILVYPYVPREEDKDSSVIEKSVLLRNATKKDLYIGKYAANGFVVSRVYRTEVFQNVRFAIGVKMYEDVRFWVDVLCIDAKWCVVSCPYYFYRRHIASACGSKNSLLCSQALESVIYVLHRIESVLYKDGITKRAYCLRFPWGPIEILQIVIDKFDLLPKDEWRKIKALLRQIKKMVGVWPYGRFLELKLKCLEVPALRWGISFVDGFEKGYLRVKRGKKTLKQRMKKFLFWRLRK